MTLDTQIITDDRRLTLDWINRELLGAPDAARGNPHEDDAEMNEPGQGLAAWAIVTTAPEGETLTDEDDPDCGPFYPSEFPDPAVCVSLDTAYGYRGPDGEGCSVLHARWVKHIRKAFPEARVWWQNEFTGEWHDGREDVPLIAFVGAGDQAEAWFHGSVLPAINEGRI